MGVCARGARRARLRSRPDSTLLRRLSTCSAVACTRVAFASIIAASEHLAARSAEVASSAERCASAIWCERSRATDADESTASSADLRMAHAQCTDLSRAIAGVRLQCNDRSAAIAVQRSQRSDRSGAHCARNARGAVGTACVALRRRLRLELRRAALPVRGSVVLQLAHNLPLGVEAALGVVELVAHARLDLLLVAHRLVAARRRVVDLGRERLALGLEALGHPDHAL